MRPSLVGRTRASVNSVFIARAVNQLHAFYQWPQGGSTVTDEGPPVSWRKKGRSTRIPRSPGVALKPAEPPHSPTVGPEILTKEGATVEADGGLARDLSPIKNCIVELVREGKGLWAAEEHRVSYEPRQKLGTQDCI